MSIRSRETSTCKGPEAERRFLCSRESKAAKLKVVKEEKEGRK